MKVADSEQYISSLWSASSKWKHFFKAKLELMPRLRWFKKELTSHINLLKEKGSEGRICPYVTKRFLWDCACYHLVMEA